MCVNNRQKFIKRQWVNTAKKESTLNNGDKYVYRTQYTLSASTNKQTKNLSNRSQERKHFQRANVFIFDSNE